MLLDVMLPFVGGNEVLKQIRLLSNVPVIMLTAKEEVEDQMESFSNGADDYIVKHFFVKNEGVVLTRDQILDSVWGYHYVGDTRTIDTIVKQLRKKLGDVAYIRTVYGVGYCFEGKGNDKQT